MTETLPAVGPKAPGPLGPPSPAEWTAMKQQASVIAKSGLAPKSVSTPEKILVIAMKGREISIPPMQALSHIHIVEGKPTMSAELMVALAQRAGHKVRVLQTSDEECVVEGERLDDPGHPSQVSFTIEDAKKAGVSTKQNWKQYPAAMLRARAISALCRFAFPDVLMGVSYVPEELGAVVDEEGQVLEEPADELVEEAEVLEDEDEHQEVLEEVARLLEEFPSGTGPKNPNATLGHAGKSLEDARKTQAMLKKKLEAALAKPSEAPEDGS